MTRILTILLIFYSLNLFSQQFEKIDNKTIFTFKNYEFIDPHPDCFNYNIPYKIRSNQNDTIKFILDKEYLFYKGKCDTICFNDTIELYTEILNLYDADSLDEFFNIQFISHGLKSMKESNLTSIKNNNEILRYSYFRNKLPITVKIEKYQDKITITKKTFSGEFWTPELELNRVSKVISKRKWRKLHQEFLKIIDFEPKEKFIVYYPNLLIEAYIDKIYSSIYLERCEWTLNRKARKSIKKLERMLRI
jgi:hypothetical protein